MVGIFVTNKRALTEDGLSNLDSRLRKIDIRKQERERRDWKRNTLSESLGKTRRKIICVISMGNYRGGDAAHAIPASRIDGWISVIGEATDRNMAVGS